MKDDRVIIPSSLRLDVLDKIHTGHQGIQKCRKRAKSGVWSAESQQADRRSCQLVKECLTCIKTKTNRAEPTIPSRTVTRASIPKSRNRSIRMERTRIRPLGRLLLAILWNWSTFSSFRKSTSQEVINHLKAIFARHGIPETVISDNRTQYSSAEFVKFAEDWGFTHITSSPKYPQSNGEAERMVQKTRNLLTKSDDLYEALLAYRATPLENEFSPAELCMGRRLRTTLPTTPSKLTPQWPEWTKVCEKEAKIETEQT